MFRPLDALAIMKRVIGIRDKEKEMKDITLKQPDDAESLVTQEMP